MFPSPNTVHVRTLQYPQLQTVIVMDELCSWYRKSECSLPYFIIPQIFSIAFTSFLYNPQTGSWICFSIFWWKKRTVSYLSLFNSCFNSFSTKREKNSKKQKETISPKGKPLQYLQVRRHNMIRLFKLWNGFHSHLWILWYIGQSSRNEVICTSICISKIWTLIFQH